MKNTRTCAPTPLRRLRRLAGLGLTCSLLLVLPARAQSPNGGKNPKVPENDVMTQLLDYSRPGANHALLSPLVGTWRFQDPKRPYVQGTVVRKPLYEGRFYTVEIIGGKLPLPVADGQMKEDNYRGLQIEGYDNGRRQFVTSALNNHIGSDIEQQWGRYDPATRTFTYTWESELIPGQKKQNRRVLRLIDADHYTEEYYETQNGPETNVRALAYSRVK